jgi:hypothetical protein
VFLGPEGEGMYGVRYTPNYLIPSFFFYLFPHHLKIDLYFAISRAQLKTLKLFLGLYTTSSSYPVSSNTKYMRSLGCSSSSRVLKTDMKTSGT